MTEISAKQLSKKAGQVAEIIRPMQAVGIQAFFIRGFISTAA